MSNYYLGLPAWAFPGWTGRYFENKPSALASYAQVFNTVEGNTTFYSMPDENTIDGWRASLEGSNFKICFKLPREVTHQRHVDVNLASRFFSRISPLKQYLGPILLQFPATVGPDRIRVIESVVRALPAATPSVLEVRHKDFFRQPETLFSLLNSHDLSLAIMDSRAVFHGNRLHPEVKSALHEKPDVPVWNQLFNGVLFVRLLLHPDLNSNSKYLQQWVRRTTMALTHGHTVYMMIHCPNNQHCPELALNFHALLRAEISAIPALSPWPVPQQSRLI